MPVSMFTKKTESENASARSEQRPSATTIATIAIRRRDQPGDNRAEHEQQDHERAGRPN
jgi:hypothetical protein